MDDFMVNETDRGWLVYFDKHRNLIWEYRNKFENETHSIGWTRVIQSQSEINIIKNSLDVIIGKHYERLK